MKSLRSWAASRAPVLAAMAFLFLSMAIVILVSVLH